MSLVSDSPVARVHTWLRRDARSTSPSSTNVAAGARTRASAVLHGVWVLVLSLLLVCLVEQIPLAALAGLLIVMGVALVRPADIRQSRRRGELWIYLLPIAGVLALNLIEGVLLGLVGALLPTLRRTARVRVDVALTLATLADVLGPERLARLSLVGLFLRIDDGTLQVLSGDDFVDLGDAELTALSGLSG